MTDDDQLDRIDRRLDRLGDELTRSREAYADFKSIVADCKLELARSEAARREGVDAHADLETFIEKLSTAFGRLGETVERETADMRDQVNAHEAALLRLMDEIKGGWR